MKIVRNIFILVYSIIVLLVGTLIISKNEYNIHRLGNISLVKINKELSTKKYKDGSLVIVKELKKEELSKDQEIFVYNEKDKTISIVKNDYEIEYNDIVGSKIININGLNKNTV